MVCRNEQEGFRLIKIAAEMELDFAQFHLGLCYGLGKGVEKNSHGALKWFLCSAEQGNADAMMGTAQTILGITELEHGIPQATHWLKKAARLGHEEAEEFLQHIKSRYCNLCAACNKTGVGAELRRCARCKIMHYCSKKCQTRHWREGHKNDCVKQDL